MNSSSSSTLQSLDDSLALLAEHMEKLTAAKSVDVGEVVAQLNSAAKSAQIVRELVSSELPQATWQTREELDALIQQIRKISEAKTQEQLRSRLLALATELECGSIVHRRAHRVDELNQLRNQAIDELRSRAALEEPLSRQNLPGPKADSWIEWACALKEPQDAESLQVLRNGFAHLDDFVANLEPSMWIAGKSPTTETPAEPERSADRAQDEQPQLETNGVEEQPRFPEELLNEVLVPAIESKTPPPKDDTPPQTEEELERTLAQERALLASMMGLDGDPSSKIEVPTAAGMFRGGSVAAETGSDSSTGIDEPKKRRKWWFATTGLVLVFAVLGAVQWRSRWSQSSNRPVEAAVEEKIAEPTPSNPEKGYLQTAASTNSAAHASSPLTPNQPQAKLQDPSVAPLLSKASPAKQGGGVSAGVLQPPAETPKDIARVTKEEVAPNSTAEAPGLIPGEVPNGVPNTVPNVVKDIPVALPKIANQVRVSSGASPALLIHEVPPQYPDLARQAHIQGTVVFQAVIGKDGTVRHLQVLKGPPMLIGAATDAVRKWRYKPSYLNGEPLEADTQIKVKFTLAGE